LELIERRCLLKIYIASSWRNQIQVTNVASMLRKAGHDVYDFTDPACHKHVIPPEKYPEDFDPSKHAYSAYINKADWHAAVTETEKP
jgi:hypothetical protein